RRKRHTTSKRDWISDVCSSDLEKLKNKNYSKNRVDSSITYTLENDKRKIVCHFRDPEKDHIDRVEYYYDNSLMKREFYSYTCYAAEYLRNINGQMRVYLRRFYNEDGTVAYEQLVDDKTELYRLPDQIFYSKLEFF